MSKAYLLVICLLFASFTGCIEDAEDEVETAPEEEIIRDWDFFAIEVDHNIVAELPNHVAIGIANLGNRSTDFNASFDPNYPMHFLEYSSDFTVSEEGTEVELSLEPGDVRILILEIFGSTSDFNSADISATMNWDSGSSSKSISLSFSYVPKGERVEIGNTTYSYYAGFLENNGRLFDTSIEYIWDNYGYFMEGTTDANRHTATLTAHHVGCNSEGDPSEYCEGSRQMIPGFDQGMLGMYVNQTLYVVIPPEDAYGTNPGGHRLGGETLIFSIRIVSVE
jgi:FKBP-type peptidyl-prolyl cis-trans isomerase 2